MIARSNRFRTGTVWDGRLTVLAAPSDCWQQSDDLETRRLRPFEAETIALSNHRPAENFHRGIWNITVYERG
jgi:hypothetical protein